MMNGVNSVEGSNNQLAFKAKWSKNASKTDLKSFIKDKTVYYTAGFIKPLTKNPVTKK